MGEQADYAIDQMLDGQWGSGRHVRRVARIKECNRCGQGDLRWQNVNGGSWRLHSPDGELHVCSPAIERVREG